MKLRTEFYDGYAYRRVHGHAGGGAAKGEAADHLEHRTFWRPQLDRAQVSGLFSME